MIKNIIFDMGGVLIDFNPEKTCYGLFDKKTADIVLREVFRSNLWRERDRGTVTSDDIMREKGHLFPKESYAEINKMVHNLFPYMMSFPKMYDLIVKLKELGYGIYLLSNASMDFYENKDGIPALSLFDGYLVSSDWKLLKPEKEIYEKLYEVFNLKPEECYFIDDVLENVEGAEKTGMKAYCYDHGNIELLKPELEKILNVKLD